ncbi:hypothetical protein [Methylocapsa acidiphila]|uniref:hypothetical protein n=1 Tax=Methylocapsa acidiphila TaxID=133552 RepID=UPI0018DB573A|nr:hypothetical protein [Methylocapsa acidiphila]
MFIPLAAICAVIGLALGIIGKNAAGIGTSLLAGVLSAIGVVTSPALLIVIGGVLVALSGALDSSHSNQSTTRADTAMQVTSTPAGELLIPVPSRHGKESENRSNLPSRPALKNTDAKDSGKPLVEGHIVQHSKVIEPVIAPWKIEGYTSVAECHEAFDRALATFYTCTKEEVRAWSKEHPGACLRLWFRDGSTIGALCP